MTVQRIQQHQSDSFEVSRRAAARRQGWRAAARASTCGYVDAYALVNFGVYASFMTGNTTSAGVRAGQRQFAMAGHSLLPIPFFMLGILGATLLAHADERRALHRLSGLVGAMLLLNVAAVYVHCPDWLSIMILSSAMGMVNTSVTNVGGQSVSLGFMTGDLNNLAKAVAKGLEQKPQEGAQGPWDTPWRRAGVLATLWVAFICGALLGAVLVPRCSAWTLVLPAVTLLGFGWRERVANLDI